MEIKSTEVIYKPKAMAVVQGYRIPSSDDKCWWCDQSRPATEGPCSTHAWLFAFGHSPIAGGAAVVPLIGLLAPLLVQEIPLIIQSFMKILNLMKSHPDTPEALKTALDGVYDHLHRSAEGVAAFQV